MSFTEFITTLNNENDASTVIVLNTLFLNILFVLFGIYGLLGVIAYIDAKLIRINDFFKITSIVMIVIESFDMLSDVFVSFESYQRYADSDKSEIIQKQILWILSVFFIIMPIFISIIQLQKEINNYWIIQTTNSQCRIWLTRYSKLLYFVSFISGSSFTSIRLFNSCLFSLNIFDMGLTEYNILHFKTKRIFSILLFENIPQLLLQIWRIYLENGAATKIVIASIIFSSLSIIIAITSMITQKRILKTQQYILISFHVEFQSHIQYNIDKLRNRGNGIKLRIANIIGINNNMINMMRPRKKPEGLHLQFYVPTNINNSKQDQIYYNELINDARNNGILNVSLINAWQLNKNSQFNINNIECNCIGHYVEMSLQPKYIGINIPRYTKHSTSAPIYDSDHSIVK